MSDSDDDDDDAYDSALDDAVDLRSGHKVQADERAQIAEDRQFAADRRNARTEDIQAEKVAAIEGIKEDVKPFLKEGLRRVVVWDNFFERMRYQYTPVEWKPWGKVGDNPNGHLELREQWLTWMACTSKVMQTVDNRHLNRHTEYLYSGPSIHFVDLQDTPAIGRRMQALSHFVECMNNFGEFPLDCVVPTPETELLFGEGKGCRTVRGMRIKNVESRVQRDAPLTSSKARAGEKWLKNFRRGMHSYLTLLFCV